MKKVCGQELRLAVVAGQFYPAGKDELKKSVQYFIDNVPGQPLKNKIYGILVPHAGYVFSGQVAAYAFKQLTGKKFDTVIIIGQSHNFHLTKPAVYSGEAFITPLGEVPVDREFVNRMINDNSGIFESNNKSHIPEHSLEVELPFLQAVLAPGFKIVPVLLSDFGTELTKYEGISKIIVNIINKDKTKKALFIISSDMSHYPAYETANTVDEETLSVLKTFDIRSFHSVCLKTINKNIPNLACAYCGDYAVITGMYLAKSMGADTVEVLKYANSGDIPEYGDKSRVVGYSAVLFTEGSNKKNIEPGKTLKKNRMIEKPAFSVSDKNQKVLLELARNTVKYYIETNKQLIYITKDEELLQKTAVFVTLTINGQLRGCIGSTVAQAELYKAVQQMALSAAFDDYRFDQVDSQDELNKIKIEISVLSPMTRIKSPDEIKQNVHGVIVRQGNQSGLFLPQVWEHFSTKEAFMDELCRQKAGLDSNAWKNPDTELYVFVVFAFQEK